MRPRAGTQSGSPQQSGHPTAVRNHTVLLVSLPTHLLLVSRDAYPQFLNSFLGSHWLYINQLFKYKSVICSISYAISNPTLSVYPY